jgi:hypothetical protein
MLSARLRDLAAALWRGRRGNGEPAIQTSEEAQTSETELGFAVSQRRRPARYLGLRPPTLMIDLLFGALMLFAFHMGDPNARSIVRHDVTLPSSTKALDGKEAKLLPLVPLRNEGSWLYELMDGTQVDVKGALALAKKKKSRLVLIIEANTPVQSYLDAEMPFRKLGVRIGLAVKKEGDGK